MEQATLGTVSFPTSCAAEVQDDFEVAVGLLHSYWFAEAGAAFEAVTRADPTCAMAYWGIAMNASWNPMARMAPSEARMKQALRALERARALAGGATARERMYIEAASALYEGPQGHLERMQEHESAMLRIVEAYPDDEEAAAFYGRIVVANAPPDDLTFSRQLYAAEVMEPLFEEFPDHPGLAHYLIHAYDAPPLAERGVDAALRYADIAPAAPHALHMPSHIFTRLGYWEESVRINARSALATPLPTAAVHPLDYMVYAYLQMGMDEAAGAVVRLAVRVTGERVRVVRLDYNFVAMRARYALERNQWSEAADLPLPSPLPQGGAPPYVAAVTRFARALGMARSGQSGRALREVEALSSLRANAIQQGDEYWPTVMEAQRLAASAWIALADADDAEALALARNAAELEETVEKHAVTPGPLLPARELLGDLLMELGRFEEAQRAYEATLERDPGRARALFGAAQAAERAGDTAAADTHYRSLLNVLEQADPERRDLQAARSWMERG
jgi:hypothetical protein